MSTSTPDLDLEDDYDPDAEAAAELKARIKELVDLGGMDPKTRNVLLLAEHRQSWDGPTIYGPFKTAKKARKAAKDFYATGEFDLDGCEVDYREAYRA